MCHKVNNSSVNVWFGKFVLMIFIPTNITGDLHNYMEWKYIIAAVCDLLSFTCTSDMAQYQYI